MNPRFSSAETGDGAVQEQARRAMVEGQLMGPDRNIKSERVLRAMGEVPRHEFVPGDRRALAYHDRPLPIGYGQTISQPYMVALMTDRLGLQPDDRVLEIGTGSGYQAAVLAKLVKEVYSIEFVEALAERATATLSEQGYHNVTVRLGDGYQGWEEQAPFDAVIVTCAPDHIPTSLVEQLKEGGTMAIPVGESGGPQELQLMKKVKGTMILESDLPVRFVPMVRG